MIRGATIRNAPESSVVEFAVDFDRASLPVTGGELVRIEIVGDDGAILGASELDVTAGTATSRCD